MGFVLPRKDGSLSKYHAKQFDQAMRDLKHLVALTHEIIDHHRKRGDAAAVAKLIFEQRHNLKVLFRQIERAKK